MRRGLIVLLLALLSPAFPSWSRADMQAWSNGVRFLAFGAGDDAAFLFKDLAKRHPESAECQKALSRALILRSTTSGSASDLALARLAFERSRPSADPLPSELAFLRTNGAAGLLEAPPPSRLAGWAFALLTFLLLTASVVLTFLPLPKIRKTLAIAAALLAAGVCLPPSLAATPDAVTLVVLTQDTIGKQDTDRSVNLSTGELFEWIENRGESVRVRGRDEIYDIPAEAVGGRPNE